MSAPEGIAVGEDGVARCAWSGATELYRDYHDREWGVPVADDRRLFEKLSLEGFQSGLSWLTILRKRDAFRTAFSGFDVEAVAGFGAADVERLLGDAGIVRHRGKIEAVIGNAGRAVELAAAEGSLAAFLWRYAPAPRPGPIDLPWLREHTTSPESEALAKELKSRGWRFVGPTTMYAFLQSMGMVNDHLAGCDAYGPAAAARAALTVPA